MEKIRGRVSAAALCLLPFLIFSCREEVLPSSARQVRFSASSGFFLPTKTEYAGGYVRDNDYERLNWVTGDGLTILSPQAVFYNKSTNPWTVFRSATNPAYCVADYAVSGTITPDGIYSTAGIAPSGENGLYWGEGAHHFFGVYPAFGSLPADVQSHVGIEIDAARTTATISAFIPGAQTHSGVKDAVKCVHDSSVDSTYIKPQMQYAWMWSAQYAPEAEKETTLLFSPMVTTFQIAVMGSGSEEVPLTRFELESESDALHGEFSAEVWVDGFDTEIKRENVRSKMMSTFTVADPSSSGGNMKVSFAFPENTKVSGSKKVTLTVFVFPEGAYDSNTISNLTISFVSPGVTRSLKLKDSSNGWVAFPAGRKINIDGITLPSQDKPWHFTVTGEDWEDEVSDVVVSPVGIIEMENLDVTDGGTLDERAYVLDVDWSGLTLDEDGGSKSDFATVRSYKDNAAKTPVPYRLEYYDGTTWKPWGSGSPAWLTIPTPTSGYAGSFAGDGLGLSMSAQQNSAADAHRNAMIAKGSYSTAFDLSTRNVATGATVAMTTANCYVADRPGKYKLPLVYGNGVKGGSVNKAAFEQTLTTNPGYLSKFKDHLDNNITSAYIGVQHSGKQLTAAILWADTPGLVTEASISGSGSSAYLNFTVPSENITQGNAVVAVLANGEVAWSWHIWVTDQNLAIQDNMGPYEGSNNNVFAPVNLGWSDAITRTYTARSCSLRVVQPVSGLESSPVLIEQPYASYTVYGRNPYYQWGRKDPLSAGTTFGEQAYSPNLAATGPVSLGTAISHPWNNYITGATTVDWCSDTWYNLWNTNLTFYGSGQFATEVIKSVYDPSPSGYMVPPQNAYSGFTTSNCAVQNASAGNSSAALVYNSSSVRFPLVGYLASTDGSYIYNGQVSHHWSAVPSNSIQAYPLTTRYTSGIVNTTSPLGRSYAVSVRPVLEEVIEPSGPSPTGMFVVGLSQDEFDASGGSGNIYVCSSAYTGSGTSARAAKPIMAWRINRYSTDGRNWSTTAPSWFTIQKVRGNGSLFDVDNPSNSKWDVIPFTVAPYNGSTRQILIEFEQYDYSNQKCYLWIVQWDSASTPGLYYNFLVGKNNEVQGYGNSVIGNGNRAVGYSNTVRGNNCRTVGVSNSNTADYTNTFGINNKATAKRSTAVGVGSEAFAEDSIAWGLNTLIDVDTVLNNMNLGDSDWWYWFMD